MFRKSEKINWIKRLPAIVVIVAGLILLVYYLIPGKPDIPAEQAISQALETTAQASSYEYKITMTTVIDSKEQVVSTVTGERENKNKIHINGKIFDSEVDFYQIESTTYSKDNLTGEWIKITDNQLNQQEFFQNELNPLANFAFKQLNTATFIGIQKVGKEKYWVYTADPDVNNQYMQILWKDFQYKFYLEPHKLLINKAEVSAVSKNNSSDKMKLTVEFKNYNGSIKVNPPKI
jgi:hypothetical protein